MDFKLFHSSNRPLSIIEPRDNITIAGKQGIYAYAQPDIMMAHAYAMKDGSKTVMIASQWNPGPEAYTWILVRNKETFFANLSEMKGKRGGYIHEVDPSTFRVERALSGGEEWISEKTPAIIGEPRFVSVEDVMQKGVQIFFLKVPELQRKIPHGIDPINWIFDEVANGNIGWLNRDMVINALHAPEEARRPNQFRPAGADTGPAS